MRISVVTAAWNSAATIRHTIESFLAQSYREAEMLVIDGASKDDTAAIARSYEDPRLRVISEPDKGIYDAFNKGLRLFTGDAMGYLNSDDKYHDAYALEAIAEGLARHDIVHGHIDFVTDHETAKVTRRWRGRPYRAGAFKRGWMPGHPTFYIRRPIAERVGEFDRSLTISADYDFMLRAIALSPDVSVGLVDKVLVDMQVGGNSTAGWRAYVKGNLQSLKSRRRHLGSGPVDWALIAKPLGKVRQWVAR